MQLRTEVATERVHGHFCVGDMFLAEILMNVGSCEFPSQRIAKKGFLFLEESADSVLAVRVSHTIGPLRERSNI